MLGEGPWVGLLVVTEVPLSLLCHLLQAQPAGREEGLGCACHLHGDIVRAGLLDLMSRADS